LLGFSVVPALTETLPRFMLESLRFSSAVLSASEKAAATMAPTPMAPTARLVARMVVSPFMMGILILTGAITTSGLLEPIILLLVSTMGFCVNYVIIPLITISVVFNIITNMSDAVNLGKFSKFSNKMALWMNGIFLAIFLAVAGIQTTVSTSVDNITIKTTQAAVSGTIPVVR